VKRAIILFDGICHLCNRFVQFVIARDTRNVFTFGALQSEHAKTLLAPFNFESQKLSTVVLLQNGNLYTQSTAALRIVKELHGFWRWLYVFIIVPPFLRDAVYSLVAKYRYNIFGKRDSCMVPTATLRERFLGSTNVEMMQ
jgi:predicted DCC family thiol-disulfide oxidoreductase YuxK